MSRYDDSHLWDRMEAATTDEERAEVAAEVVMFHRGFITQYLTQHALARWDAATRDDYLSELLLVAFEKALSYDRTYVGARGKATFPSYLRPYLQPVRWRVAGHQGGDAFSFGVETTRLMAGAAAIAAEVPDASDSRHIAEELSKAHGKPISPQRARRLAAPPSTTSLDRGVGSSTWPGLDRRPRLGDTIPSVEDISADVVAEMEKQAAVELVRDLLAQMQPLTPLERAILMERLMAPPRLEYQDEVIHPGPLTLRAIGKRFGVSDELVRKRERQLLERMRAILDDTAA